MDDDDAGQAGDGPGRRWQEAALDAVRYFWGEFYEIGHDDERGFWARRRDGLGGLITAHDAEGLGTELAANFALKRVPR